MGDASCSVPCPFAANGFVHACT
uniref:Uncharacterized protein n=1 Tax=Arundo donax TaxID=35708 RepID=A0A0A9C544_ARUDO